MNEYIGDYSEGCGPAVVDRPSDHLRFADKSLNRGRPTTETFWRLPPEAAHQLISGSPALGYVVAHFGIGINKIPFSIVTHPSATATTKEKLVSLGGGDRQIIKTLLYYNEATGDIFALTVPDNGKIDLRSAAQILEVPKRKFRSLPQEQLPDNMKFGTCNPFISRGYVAGMRESGREVSIIFDRSNLTGPPDSLADFSVSGLGLNGISDSQVSFQAGYGNVYNALRSYHQLGYGDPQVVRALDISYLRSD
jgi:hypothetical protein